MLLSSWKGHEGEVLQVNAASPRVIPIKIQSIDAFLFLFKLSEWTSPGGSQHLISSSLDQTVSVWSPEESGKFRFNLRGWSEPVHCVGLCGGELVTATTGNRIGVHTSLTANASFTSTKLRSDTIRGVLTAMAVVPLNRMLVLGSDTGSITLLS